jgi:hypothetical protein
VEWVFKQDVSVRLPWHLVAHPVAGVGYLRPEVALLFKTKQDRDKDRADLTTAPLNDEGREGGWPRPWTRSDHVARYP